MADKVEISVIVPVYKGVRFLREALESLQAQTFRDWECICVDDGSKDGSGALADEIAAADSRIRVLHQANAGTSEARNTALAVARGLYVAFLDEDDAYDPRMLETLYMVIVKTGADVVGCDFAPFAENAHPHFSANVPSSDSWRTAEGAGVADLAADGYAGFPYEIWRNLYRRERIVGHPFPAGVRVEQDQLWNYTLLPRIRKYVRIPWPGYAWRASSTGGYLHPDFVSMMSRLESTRKILGVMFDQLRLSSLQRERFRRALALDFEENVLRPLRFGFKMDREHSRTFRRALNGLRAYGVDVRSVLHFKKRVLWTMFMLTGWAWWIRK